MSLSHSVLHASIESGLWKLWISKGPEGPLMPSNLMAAGGEVSMCRVMGTGGIGVARDVAPTDVREPLEFIKATSPEAFGHAGGCGAHCIGCCLRADVCKML